MSSFDCEQCGKRLCSKRSLTEHMRRHTGEDLLTCGQCGKTFVSVSKLRSHEKIHRGVKPYQCRYCRSAFFSQGDVRRHEKTHLPRDDTYRCHSCDKSFAQKSSLAQHNQRFHGDSFPCRECGAVFAERSGLELHRRQHKYKCLQCDRFFSPSRIRRHLFTHARQAPQPGSKPLKVMKVLVPSPSIPEMSSTRSQEQTRASVSVADSPFPQRDAAPLPPPPPLPQEPPSFFLQEAPEPSPVEVPCEDEDSLEGSGAVCDEGMHLLDVFLAGQEVPHKGRRVMSMFDM